MLSYFTFFEEKLSPRLWNLWPQIHSCLTEFAIESWPAVLVPLDNLISRDTATFLGGGNGRYLQSAFDMVAHSLNNPHVHEGDVISAPRLLCVVLQNCRGQVDQWVEPYLALVVARLSKTESKTLRSELMVVISNAIFYSPALALQALQRLGAVEAVFSQWFELIFKRRRGGKPEHFRLISQKRSVALGLIALLNQPDEALPPQLAAGLPQVLAGVLRVLEDLKVQEEEKAKEEEEEGEEEEDEEDFEEEEEEEEEGFTAIEADQATERKLRAAARSWLGKDGENDDDSDEEGWTDEDEDAESPLDQICPFAALAEALQAGSPARAATLSAAGGPALAAALETAATRRREAEAAAAKK